MPECDHLLGHEIVQYDGCRELRTSDGPPSDYEVAHATWFDFCPDCGAALERPDKHLDLVPLPAEALVRDLPLSDRVKCHIYRALDCWNDRDKATVGALLDMHVEDFFAMRNCGRVTVGRICGLLAEHGQRLKPAPPSYVSPLTPKPHQEPPRFESPADYVRWLEAEQQAREACAAKHDENS